MQFPQAFVILHESPPAAAAHFPGGFVTISQNPPGRQETNALCAVKCQQYNPRKTAMARRMI